MDNSLIELIKDQVSLNMSCLHTAIDSICAKYNILTWYLYSVQWNFEYKEIEELPIYKKIRVSQSLAINQFLLKYFGMHLDYRKGDLEEAILILSKIGEQFSGEIIIGIDSFYCPWHNGYLTSHILHYCILESADSDGNFICLDPFLGNKKHVFDKNLFYRAYRSLRIINVCKHDLSITPIQIYKELVENYNSKISDMNRVYNKLISDLQKVTSEEELFENQSLDLCSILIVIKQISKNRMGLSGMLVLLDEMYAEKTIKDLYYNFYSVAKDWEKINSLFMKIKISHVLTPKNMDSITIKIGQVFEKELLIYSRINDFIMTV